MAKRVIVGTVLLFMACVCPSYALTIPGINRLYGWLGITQNDSAGVSVSATAKLPPTPISAPTRTPRAVFTPTAEKLRAMLNIVQSEGNTKKMGEAFPPPVWTPMDNVDWVSFGALECEGIPVGNGQSRLYRHPVPYTAGAPTPYPDGKPKVLLQLKGSYYQMGYAHGWAMAREINDLWNNEVAAHIPPGAQDWYDRLDISGDVKAELEGIRDGLDACGVHLTVKDIFVMNAYWWFVGCSSFSYWGTGNLLVGRNTDLTKTGAYGDQLLWRSGLVISREPAVYGHKKVVTFGLPGYISAEVGFNEAGIGSLGHRPSLLLSVYNYHCEGCGCCKPLGLSLLGGLHTQLTVESLMVNAGGESVTGAIYHVFGKDYESHATSIELDGAEARQRFSGPGDPEYTLVVAAGCAKEWDDCGGAGGELYEGLVNLINSYPHGDLDSVLRIMWGAAPKDGDEPLRTFHRFAINAHSIPSADIKIILNVEDSYTGYSGRGLQGSWNDLF